MKIVNEYIQFPDIEYETPNNSGYVLLLAEIERPFPLKPNSPHKKAIIAEAKALCEQLNALDIVVSAHILDAFIIPPGNKPGRKILEKDHPDVHIAAYDLVVQIETKDVDSIQTLQNNTIFKQLVELLKNSTQYFRTVIAKNVRKIGEVDKNRNGVFLYNFFMRRTEKAYYLFGNTRDVGL